MKKNRGSMVKNMIASCVALASVLSFTAEPEVTDVVAKQRFAWNGLEGLA